VKEESVKLMSVFLASSLSPWTLKVTKTWVAFWYQSYLVFISGFTMALTGAAAAYGAGAEPYFAPDLIKAN